MNQTSTTIDALAGKAAESLRQKLKLTGPAELAVVTGSGLGGLATLGREVAAVDYGEIPGLGRSDVKGHTGRWSLLELEGRRIFCLGGRRHFYEGLGVEATAFAVRVLARLGTERVIFTNAAGGLSVRLRVGDLMLVRDHLNLMNCNPLLGHTPAAPGPRGAAPCELSDLYDEALGAALLAVACEQRLELKEGIYVGVCGPCYETPAEAALFQRLGGDAIGMSTVPEVLMARSLGLHVAALSLVTNSHCHRAAPPSHAEVLQIARQSGERLKTLLAAFIRRLPPPAA